MEKSSDLETKYQKLATEYSKVRSQATVLKKAVLDEQAKSLELKEQVKEHEQKSRKHSQEMESLTFRNELLTKRILVLQQDLQALSHTKKGKSKPPDNSVHIDSGMLNEELQKKILENAQLLSTVADKNLEITNNKGRIQWLEERLEKLEKEISDVKCKHKEEIENLRKQNQSSSETKNNKKSNDTEKQERSSNDDSKKQVQIEYWKREAERWQAECEMLRSKPDSNEQLTEYYESQMTKLLEQKQAALAEANSLWAENRALNKRLENLILEEAKLQCCLEKCNEELRTTSENYKAQLDAMTEHLAAQNEKITGQCDEIQNLKHRLSSSKK